MKIERQRLTQAINIANMVIERRNTIPILSHIAIQPGADTIRVIGTDLDIEVVAEVDCQEPGSEALTLPAPDRLARVLNLGDRLVEITRSTEDKEKTRVAVRSGRLDLEMIDLPFEDFPRQPQSGLAPTETKVSRNHIDTILRVARACSTEETRYYLNGVYIHREVQPSTVDGARLQAAATDGHRLYVAPLAVPGAEAMGRAMPENAGQRGIIIPRKAVNLLRQLRKRMDGDISFSIRHAKPDTNRDKSLAPPPAGMLAAFSFQTKDRQCRVTISTKIIDGTFPDYRRAIPTGDQDKVVQFKRADLLRAVQLIAATSGERTRAIRLTFDPTEGESKEGRLRVSMDAPEAILKAATYVDALTSVREPFSMGFNGKYLADICDVSEGDSLVIETMDAGSPAKIASPSGDGFRTVLMPMRI